MMQRNSHPLLQAMQQELLLAASELTLDEAALLFQELANWASYQYEVCIYQINTSEIDDQETHD